MLLTVLPVVLFHGRSAGGETQWGGSDGPPAWPLPPVAAAADRTPPVLRAGRAAHRSQSALEPFYKRRRCPVSNATMLTQRYNAGWVGGGNYQVVATPSEDYFPFAVSQHVFPSQDEVLCIDRGFLVQRRSWNSFGLNAAQPPSLPWRRTASVRCYGELCLEWLSAIYPAGTRTSPQQNQPSPLRLRVYYNTISNKSSLK